MVVAEFLGADAVVVPISSNDAIDSGSLASVTEPKTKIGSPFVIAGMQHAVLKGRQRICGWEANGDFLTGSDIERNGKLLTALPTHARCSAFSALCFVCGARTPHHSTGSLRYAPRRFSRVASLRELPHLTSLKIMERFSPSSSAMQEVHYHSDHITAQNADGRPFPVMELVDKHLIRLGRNFKSSSLLNLVLQQTISGLNCTDGVRITFGNGDVAHIRPSRNADELRIYAVANSQERGDAIASQGVQDPDVLLRRLEMMV